MALARLIVVAAAMGALAACSGGEKSAEQTPSGAPTDAAGATGVAREEVPAPTPSATPAPPPAAAIQTQPGPNNYQVALNRVAVTGDVLTVALTYSGGRCCAYAKLDEVSVIDDATAQRLSVLKDNSGKWMASPMDSRGDRLAIGLGGNDSPRQVWFKFPAPPATSKTVSIALPEVAPFDAVPVTR